MNTVLIALFASCLLAALGLHLGVRRRQRAEERARAVPSHRANQQARGLGRLTQVRFGQRGGRAFTLDGEPEIETADYLETSLMLELLATMQETGLPLATSLQRLAELPSAHSRDLERVATRLQAGLNWQRAWVTPHGLDSELVKLRDALAIVTAAGAPSADILRATAARARRTEFRRAEQSAAKLGVKLVVPLGVCSLPAFICLGVIPVLIALVPASLGR